MFPSAANIIVVGPEASVPQPHKTVVIQTGQYVDPSTGFAHNYLGATPNEHCHQRNDSPFGTSYVYNTKVMRSLETWFADFYINSDTSIEAINDWRNASLPLSTDLLTDYIAQVALHECCHTLGLVPSASAKYDDHNNCRCGAHYMDSGEFRKPPVHLGFVSSLIPRWMAKNRMYLQFVFQSAQ